MSIPKATEGFILDQLANWGAFSLVVIVLVGVIIWQHLTYKARATMWQKVIADEKAERLQMQEILFTTLRDQAEKYIKVVEKVERVVDFLDRRAN